MWNKVEDTEMHLWKVLVFQISAQGIPSELMHPFVFRLNLAYLPILAEEPLLDAYWKALLLLVPERKI